MSQLTNKIKKSLRHIRIYFAPSRYAATKQTVNHSVPIPPDKPLCILDFKSALIDNGRGRYLHHLITEFEQLGYHICYTHRFRFLSTFTSKTYKKYLINHPFTIIPPARSYPQAGIVITDAKLKPTTSTQNIVTINYEKVLPPAHEEYSLSLPFFIHPRVQEDRQLEQLNSADLTAKNRCMKILFAGNSSYPKYDNPIFAKRFKILSRHQCLEALRKTLPVEQFHQAKAYEELLSPPHPAFTLATAPDCKIPQDQWLKTMSFADFYLATPGTSMPFCHNLIEALAAGAIPILQYPQYLQPHLEHKKNCLVFDDAESLIEVVNFAMTAPAEEITRLRQGAMKFYEDYLVPGSFAKKLLTHSSNELTLYVNAYRVPHERANEYNKLISHSS